MEAACGRFRVTADGSIVPVREPFHFEFAPGSSGGSGGVPKLLNQQFLGKEHQLDQRACLDWKGWPRVFARSIPKQLAACATRSDWTDGCHRLTDHVLNAS